MTQPVFHSPMPQPCDWAVLKRQLIAELRKEIDKTVDRGLDTAHDSGFIGGIAKAINIIQDTGANQ